MNERTKAARRNPVPVVCALLIRDGHVLLARRPAGKHLELKWEFPGGKVEPGEEPSAALIREIREELGCEIAIRERLPSRTHRYERGEIELIPFVCELEPGSGEPHPREHDAIVWAAPDSLAGYDLAEADVPVAADFFAAAASIGSAAVLRGKMPCPPLQTVLSHGSNLTKA